ncbi:MAG TPA: NnrU family protein [Burkholderiaceae bacterium]|nr:NnrU family protein [Burkholderiaceae bacterium]
MTLLILGLILFLGVHSVSIVSPAWRDAMQARLGEGPWKGLYSLLSIAGFVLIVVGYGLARQDPVVVYVPPTWLRHLALLLLVPVFPLLLAAYLPGRIKTAAKHPMLLSVKLWATAHLLANGNAADVLLFGGFLAWAVADRISFKHRAQRPLPGAPAGPLNDAIAVVGGLAIYALFIFGGHAWLIGVAPI